MVATGPAAVPRPADVHGIDALSQSLELMHQSKDSADIDVSGSHTRPAL